MASINVDPKIDLKTIEELRIAMEATQKAAAGVADAWKGANKQVVKNTKAVNDNREAAEGLAAVWDKVQDSFAKIKLYSEGISRHWTNMLRASSGVARNIKEMTLSLLKWAGITTLISGLTGIAGFFGMDRLAQGVSSDRSAAMSLNTAYGARKSLMLNFGRFGDMNSMLSNINRIQTGSDKRALRLMGMGAEYDSMDSSDVTAEYIKRATRVLKGTPTHRIQNVMQQLGIDSVMSVQDAQRLRHSEEGEVGRQGERYEKNKEQFSLTPQETRRWQDFLTTLDESKKRIENTFVVGFGGLTGPLTSISEGFTHLVEILVPESGEDGVIAGWLKKFDGALKEFNDYLEGKTGKSVIMDFLVKLKDIAVAIGDFLAGVYKLGEKLGIVSPSSENQSGGGSSSGGDEKPASPSTKTSGEGSHSWRNHNQGNIKYGKFAVAHGAIGKDATGFAIFKNDEAGRAAQRALWDEKYSNVGMEEAARRWSNGGYGAGKIGAQGSRTWGSYSEEEKERILERQKDAEGWYPSESGRRGGANENPQEAGGMPTSTRTKISVVPYPGNWFPVNVSAAAAAAGAQSQ